MKAQILALRLEPKSILSFTGQQESKLEVWVGLMFLDRLQGPLFYPGMASNSSNPLTSLTSVLLPQPPECRMLTPILGDSLHSRKTKQNWVNGRKGKKERVEG